MLFRSLGQVLGNRALARDDDPRDLLASGEGARIPQSMQLMVHAGLCLALARHTYDRLGPNPTSAEIRRAAARIAELARQNLLPGYAGIGYEAWGMVTQFFYRPLLSTVIEAMGEIDPQYVPYLWHGAGRASYFVDFMPSWNEPWPAFPLIDRMVVNGVSRQNLLAGLGSGMTIVNMKTPAILEAVEWPIPFYLNLVFEQLRMVVAERQTAPTPDFVEVALLQLMQQGRTHFDHLDERLHKMLDDRTLKY